MAAQHQATLARQSFSTRLAKLNLSRPAYRIWMLLEPALRATGPDSWLGITQFDIARMLGLTRPTVSRAFTELQEARLLERNPEDAAPQWRLGELAIEDCEVVGGLT
jgi:DNA-binding MarR family transcriptional regulator